MRKNILLGVSFLVLAVSMFGIYTMIAFAPTYHSSYYPDESRIKELVDVARQNGMLRYKKEVMIKYPEVNTEKLDSMYNADLKNGN